MNTRVLVPTILVLLLATSLAAASTRPVELTDPLPRAASSDPAVVGRWEPPFDGQAPAVNMVLLHDGRVLYWSGVEEGGKDEIFFFNSPAVGESRLLDPKTRAITTPTPATGGADDLFCSGQVVLPDGRVLVAGGSSWHTLDESVPWAIESPGADPAPIVDGTRDARVFDPATGQWSVVGDMNFGRWYPTLLEMPDGRALVASGVTNLTDPRTQVPTLETTADGGLSWGALPDAPGAAPGQSHLLPLYPRLFIVPSGALKGKIFYETVGTLWGPFGERPDEATWSLEQVYDPATNAWTTLSASAYGARQHAASVMLPLSPDDGYTASILTFGGTLQRSVVATGASELTRLGPTITHTLTASLDHPRWHLNGVGLPDGTVLAVGGGMYDNVVVHGQPNVAVLTAEQFDPLTRTWTDRAAMTVPRMYHSTAILLPDGRVLAGGHVPLPVPWKDARENLPYEDQVEEKRLEVYDPPYLFWDPASRPGIVSAPASIAYGSTFTVTANTTNVDDAILVHPGATTHANDMGQRSVVLKLVAGKGTGTLTFQAPPDGAVAPPGDWMLFLRHKVAGQGAVPSVASFVHLS